MVCGEGKKRVKKRRWRDTGNRKGIIGMRNGNTKDDKRRASYPTTSARPRRLVFVRGAVETVR